MELRTLRYFVAVAEELNFGRAAARLKMTQPPLSRAIQLLEVDLGSELLHRSSAGVTLTPAGVILRDEAKILLAQADGIHSRVSDATGTATLTVGTLANSAEHTLLATAYRRRHRNVRVRIRETDLTDPTAGLRTGLVDVALTRTPFDTTGILTHVLRSDPVAVIMRSDDPLADRTTVTIEDLVGRTWFQLPEDTDTLWRKFWTGPAVTAGAEGKGPVVRTVHECVQSVLWNNTIGLTPFAHTLPEGITAVPLVGTPASQLVVAWNRGDRSPLIHSFVQSAIAIFEQA